MLSEMCAFHIEMHKTADFNLTLLASWELVTEGCPGRPMKCVHFTYFNEMRDRKTLTRNDNSLVYICVILLDL